MKSLLEILESIPENTIITRISDFIPLGHPDYWETISLLKVLMSLDFHFRYDGQNWRKISNQEYIDFRKDRYKQTFYILMTDPHKLDF